MNASDHSSATVDLLYLSLSGICWNLE